MKCRVAIFSMWIMSCFHFSSAQVSFMKYTVQDGLVANPIRCIYQDRKGFIWIGTFEGLSRYDGYKFTNYTNSNGLSHNFINSLIEINGSLLIGENNGAIDVIRNNRFQNRFMAASAVNAIIPYRDRLLITTDGNGFYEYKNGRISLPLQQKTNTALGHSLSINDSLLLTDGTNEHLIVFKSDLRVYASLKKRGIDFYSLYQDSKKRMWACTSVGLKSVQIASGRNPTIRFGQLPIEFNLPPLNNIPVTSMIEDKDGSFWIGTTRGLVRLFPEGGFHVYNEQDGLPSALVYTLYRDKESNLWIGTALGLAKWVSKNNVVFYNTENEDFKNDVSAMLPLDNGKAILKTAHGLQYFYFETKEFKNILPLSKRPYTLVSATSPLLVHYDTYIGALDTVKDRIIPFEKLDTDLIEVQFASAHPGGTIFLGTGRGLYVQEKKSLKRILPHRITCLITDKDGNIWAGTWFNGLFRITIKKNPDTAYQIQDITPAFGEQPIRGLYTDSKNNIWVGTRYAGAFCLTPRSDGSFGVQQFNRVSGLMSNWVIAFAETKSGDMWLGTYLGLDKLVKEPAGYRVFSFSKTVNFFAEIRNILPTGNNHWLCLANTGIAAFNDEDLHRIPPLQATILSASLGVLENKLTFQSPTERVSLSPNQNAARFEFSALGFINERQMLYSYRLKGTADSTWSKPENIHEASYVSLSPGDYTFEVRAFGFNGQPGNAASFSFRIRPPFSKTAWFYILCIIAIGLFFYTLYRYRVNHLMRVQKVRNRIATDLHDDIGSTLTNISVLSELGDKSLEQPAKARQYLQRITEEVNASGQALDDIIWSVNTRNDTLDEMVARMRRFASELFDNTATKYHFQIDKGSEGKKLDMEQRRDIYLLYKEATSNIRKHAGAENVFIRLSLVNQFFEMEIKDDGKGFDPNDTTHRNGLKNLKARAEKWKGMIKIDAGKGEGAVVYIRMLVKHGLPK